MSRSESIDNCGCKLVRTENGLHIEDCSLHAAAPDLLSALEIIHANAGESVDWIRRHTSAAIAKARGEG